MSKQTPTASHSHHILPTAANLLGFTFLVLTSIKGLGLSPSGLTDKMTGVCVVLFALSTLLSFMSMRTEDRHTVIDYEKWAGRTFFAALAICVALSVLLVLDVAHFGK